MITIGFSTREDNPDYQKYLQKTCMFKECQVIQKINNGDKSLSQVYNEILEESIHDIVVFVHDDLEFDTNNWGVKLMKLFERNPEQGIIGLTVCLLQLTRITSNMFLMKLLRVSIFMI